MTESAILKKRVKEKKKVNAGAVIGYIVLALIALTYIIPFYAIIITSFKETNAIATATPFIWFPSLDQLSVRSYGRVFTTYTIFATGESMVLSGLINTLKIAVPVTIVGMFSSSIAAYSFAKIKFIGKNFLFSVLLFSMMIPGIILLRPSYLLYSELSLLNTFFPLMVPAMFGSAACVFFLRQFFYGIPDELVDAAKVDGLNYMGIYFVIMLPLAVPALLAQAILGFIACYNDYLNPLIYCTEEKMYTLQVALQMFSSGNTLELPTVLAASILAMLPCVLIYFFAQKYFVQGIAMSGLKA